MITATSSSLRLSRYGTRSRRGFRPGSRRAGASKMTSAEGGSAPRAGFRPVLVGALFRLDLPFVST
jgi:hypothetical protein